MSGDTFTCCDTPMPWPDRGQDQQCPECGLTFEHDGIDIGAGARVKDPQPEPAGFPEGYTGAGPVYAAVPMGEPWLDMAARGATTYVLQARDSSLDPEASGEEIDAACRAYAGQCAFLDRGQAEEIADARGDGVFSRWDGLTGYQDRSAKADAEFREADTTITAFPDGLEAGS